MFTKQSNGAPKVIGILFVMTFAAIALMGYLAFQSFSKSRESRNKAQLRAGSD